AGCDSGNAPTWPLDLHAAGRDGIIEREPRVRARTAVLGQGFTLLFVEWPHDRRDATDRVANQHFQAVAAGGAAHDSPRFPGVQEARRAAHHAYRLRLHDGPPAR